MDIQKTSGSAATHSYHGQDKLGRIRLKRQGKKYLVAGHLFKRNKSVDSAGKTKWSRQFVATTPGSKTITKKAKSVIAVCNKSGASFRVIGFFQEVATSSTSEDLNNTVDASTPTAAPTPQQVDAVSEQTKKPSVKQNLVQQLEILSAMRASGFDPDMRMSLIPAYLQESKASLYRKMGKQFPHPTKRGKCSFWPMSIIEAYKAGQLVGGAA
jgi:hypothetical protein